MNETLIPFICTKCGGSTFKPARKGKTIEDFIDAPCANCGTVLTEGEIKTQAQKMAADLVRKKSATVE